MTLSKALAEAKAEFETSRRHDAYGRWTAAHFNRVARFQGANRAPVSHDNRGLVGHDELHDLFSRDHD
jgi:hypothetical protein